MKDTLEGLRIVWKREPLTIVAVAMALLAALVAIAERLYRLAGY